MYNRNTRNQIDGNSYRPHYQYNDDGIEAIAPNLAKTISEMDKALEEITTYEDDIEGRGYDDFSSDQRDSWDNRDEDEPYYDENDDWDDDASYHDKSSLGEKLVDCFYGLSSFFGRICECLVGFAGAQPRKVWLVLAGFLLLGALGGGGYAIAQLFTGGGEDSDISSSIENTPPDSSAPLSREDAIKHRLSSISDLTLLNDKSSPQAQAQDWIINEDVTTDPDDNMLVQKYVLAVLYLSLHGSGWTSNSFWMDANTSECEWFGVHCTEHGHVKSLELSNNNVIGLFPIEVKYLESLENLVLKDNFLDGAADSIFEIKSLKTIELSRNQLHGPISPAIGSMHGLETIVIKDNFLSGSIPRDFFNLKSLKAINFSRNNLSGFLSIRLGELTNLEELILKGNKIAGYIPAEISNLKKLKVLDMNTNSITGHIPDTMNMMEKLQYFSIYDNFLDGWLPNTLFLAPSLEKIDISNNYIGGELPNSIGHLTHAKKLIFANNGLVGELPSEIGDLAQLEALELESNGISGNIPDTLSEMKSLKRLILAKNSLIGTIPYSLYDMSSLQVLSISENKISGHISSNMKRLTNLREAYFWSNMLTGTIPEQIGDLSSLDIFQVNHNQITGTMPSSVCYLSLDSLFADCAKNSAGEVKVECDCCHVCYS